MIQKCILWVVFLPNAFQIGYWRNRNPQTLMGADKKYPNRSQLFLAKGPRKGPSSKVEMITVYSDQTPQKEKKKSPNPSASALESFDFCPFPATMWHLFFSPCWGDISEKLVGNQLFHPHLKVMKSLLFYLLVSE